MKEIYTKKGETILVDDEDYDALNRYPWYVTRDGYVHCKRLGMYIHQLIGKLHKKVFDEVHHESGEPKDNRKQNLEFLSASEHKHKRGPQRNSETGVKGVCYVQRRSSYLVQCKGFVGWFKNLEDAKRAYNERAIIVYGPNTYLNH